MAGSVATTMASRRGVRLGRILAATALLLSFAVAAWPAEPEDLFALDLADLARVRVRTASRGEDTALTAPAAITVFSAEQLRAAGVRTVFELLELVPGYTGLHGINSGRAMVVRGLAADNGVLVLLDGMPVNDAFTGNYPLFDQPVADFDRIEVVRGPGSALYGGNALVGVINLISHPPQAGNRRGEFIVGAGTENGREAYLRVAGTPNDDWPDLTISAGVSSRETDGEALELFRDRLYTPQPGNFLPPLSNPTLTSTERREAMQVRSGFFNADYAAWRLRYSYVRVESMPLFSIRGVVTEPGDTEHIEALNALRLSWQGGRWHDWQFSPTAYYALHQSRVLGDSEPPQIWADENQDGLNELFLSGIIESFLHDSENRGIELAVNGQLTATQALSLALIHDETELTYARKFANVTLRARAPVPVFPVQDMTDEFIDSDITRRQQAALLEYRWRGAAGLSITAGMRASQYSDFGATSNPRLALVYDHDQRWYGKLLYGEAFVPPSFVQLYDRTPVLTEHRVRGNSELNASEIKTSELQFGYRADDRWLAALTLFRNQTENEIFFDSSQTIQRWRNLGARQAHGVELEFERYWRNDWQLRANYAYQHTDGADTGLVAGIHPPHRANLIVDWRGAQGWNAQARLRYYSSTEREPSDLRPGLDAKSYLDLQLSQQLLQPGLRVALTIANAMDTDGRDETAQADGIVDDIPRAGRSFWLQFGYRWP